MNAIFRSWIQNFGAAIKFLPENGAEIANAAFLEMCKPMNITEKVTAAESAFSNGLVEQHNFIIIKMMDKTLEESQFSLDLALSWCLNAKNPLTNVHGFSPFQLALGKTQSYQPSTFIERTPNYQNYHWQSSCFTYSQRGICFMWTFWKNLMCTK